MAPRSTSKPLSLDNRPAYTTVRGPWALGDGTKRFASTPSPTQWTRGTPPALELARDAPRAHERRRVALVMPPHEGPADPHRPVPCPAGQGPRAGAHVRVGKVCMIKTHDAGPLAHASRRVHDELGQDVMAADLDHLWRQVDEQPVEVLHVAKHAVVLRARHVWTRHAMQRPGAERVGALVRARHDEMAVAAQGGQGAGLLTVVRLDPAAHIGEEARDVDDPHVG